jgi:hypothetical protein
MALTIALVTCASVMLFVQAGSKTAGVDLGPDRTQQAEPGESITYDHVLTNTGSATDTFSVDVLSTQGWPVGLLSETHPTETQMLTLELGAQISTALQVSLTVPVDASGVTEVTLITATSQLSPTVVDSAIDTTYVPATVYLPLVMRRWPPSSCIPDPPGESDNVNDALTVCSGQTVSGQVSDDDLDDVYKILTVANQQLTISMNGSGGDADLYLYPPGTTDVNTDPYSDVSDNYDNNEYLAGTVLVGGFWYIDVYSYEGTTNYNVTITLSGPAVAETKTFSFGKDNKAHNSRQNKLSPNDHNLRYHVR